MMRLSGTRPPAVAKLLTEAPAPRSIIARLRSARRDALDHVRKVGLAQALKDASKAYLKPCFLSCCKRVAASSLFNALTTLLTVYALFGDDLRLLRFEKEDDAHFDTITLSAMAAFCVEIVAQTFGKVGYKYGFFFWLDILSTGTLILDITAISEAAFGDTISAAQRSDGGSASRGSGSGTEAARAARMSRVGTKAGRVVRLIRLVRLIRFVKVYKKSNYQEKPKDTAPPGLDWEDDDEHGLENESAVSKKLSEHTTRRVVILVLVIMLALPFFTPGMYMVNLPSAATFGLNNLYRTWRDGVQMHNPLAGAAEWNKYLASKEREVYISSFYQYAYFHNPFIDDRGLVPDSASMSPLDSFGRTFWVGVSNKKQDQADEQPNGTLQELFLPRFFGLQPYDLNEKWRGTNNAFFAGNMTNEPRSLFDRPWSETNLCVKDSHRGVSLIEDQEPLLGCPERLRYQERAVLYPSAINASEWAEMYFMFVFDRRSGSKMEAMLNIFQTLFICLLLGAGALTFSNDANKYVLTPIERMIANVEKIRKNPLAAMSIGDQESQKQEDAKRKMGHRKSHTHDSMSTSASVLRRSMERSWLSRKILIFKLRWKALKSAREKDPRSQPEPMETVVLEKTIIKIGSLLALGFGEAGAKILAQNMLSGDNAVLNAITPGRDVRVIFGVAHIRNFTDATEILQEQVMIFVNRIAGLVHGCVNEFFGSPNLSVGDAFLLTWPLEGIRPEKESKLADMSLVALCKLTAAISRSPALGDYRSHPKLAKRLPNYRVRLGLSLHTGRALEGAIGSEFKIDASYLSPNIGVAQRLQNATKHYGVLMVLSDTLVSMLSDAVAGQTRAIDRVSVQGWEEGPLRIHTLDLDDLAVEGGRGGTSGLGMPRERRTRNEMRTKKAERWAEEYIMASIFERDQEVVNMRAKFSDEFFAEFRMAYLNFEAGEWEQARVHFLQTRELLVVEDGPTMVHLKYIAEHGGKAPADWCGQKPLPSPK